MKKQIFLLIGTLFLAISVLVLSVPKKAMAFWPFDLFSKNTNSSTGQFPDLIQRLIDKFKLNPNEVQNVINEANQEKRNLWQERQRERLQQAVDKGIITEEQKKKILAKQQDWEEKAAKIAEEQRKLWEEKRQWFSDQGIDLEKLGPYCDGLGLGLGGHKGKWGRF